MTNVPHSPTPWTSVGAGIQAPRARRVPLKSGRMATFRVAVCKDGELDEVKANAAFIIKACNEHYVLASALLEAEKHIKAAIELGATGVGYWEDLQEAIRPAIEAVQS